MLPTLIEKLSIITDEEREYLAGKKTVETGNYFSSYDDTTVTKTRLFAKNAEKRHIEVRTHTRFIDFPLHAHDYIEMMYVCKGSITHVIDDTEITLEKGGVLLLNTHVTHAIKKAGAGDIGVNFIISSAFFETLMSEFRETNIFTDFLIENMRTSGKPSYMQFNIDGVLPLENLMENLVYSLINRQGEEPQILQKTMALMLTYFLSFEGILVTKLSTNDYVNHLKNAVLNYIHTDYRNASLTDLAEKLGLTHTYLCKWIVANMEMSFKELLVEHRFKVAEYLLKTTDLSVSDIASAVGYENPSYFYRQFRKRNGKTPRAIRDAGNE